MSYKEYAQAGRGESRGASIFRSRPGVSTWSGCLMRVPTPTSRSGNRIYLSLWDLFWAVITPILALYLRDEQILSHGDWGIIGYYWLLSTGSALVAFFAFRLQDGMTRYFSV